MSLPVGSLRMLVLLLCASAFVMHAGLPDVPLTFAPVNRKSKECLAYKTRSTTYYPDLVFRAGLMSTDLTRLNDGVYANMNHQNLIITFLSPESLTISPGGFVKLDLLI